LRKAARDLRFEKARTSLSRGDAENLPFSDEIFDAVVSVGAVEYFPDPDRALKEMTRVTKHGGKVIVGGQELDWFKKLSLHRVFYTPETQNFKKQFYQAGLQTVNTALTGVNTLFGTNEYVLVVNGTKE
jgi:ubiquinone/menaquinone biosynthesis C-methylase UbiE